MTVLRLCARRACRNIVALWARIVRKLQRIRRLQRIWGHLGNFLRDLNFSDTFRARLLGAQLGRARTEEGAGTHVVRRRRNGQREQQIAAVAQQPGTVQNALEESRRREEDLNTSLQQVSGGVALGGGLQETMNQMVATQQAILDATKRGDQKKVTLVYNRGLAKPNKFDGFADFLQWKI